MAGIFSFFRSIRVRLLFLFIIIVIALLNQVIIVAQGQATTDDYRETGQQYLSQDQAILNGLAQMGEINQAVIQGQVDSYINEILYTNDIITDKNQLEVENFRNIVNQVNDSIIDRNSHGYVLRADQATQLTSNVLQTGELDIGGYDIKELEIINTGQNDDSAARLIQTLVDQIKDGNLNLIESYVVTLNNGRDTANDATNPTFAGQLITIQNSLIEDLFEKEGIVGKINAIHNRTVFYLTNDTNYSNGTNLLDQVNIQFDVMQEYIQLITDFGNQIAFTDLEVVDSIDLNNRYNELNTKVEELFTNVTNRRSQTITPLLQNINGTSTQDNLLIALSGQFHALFNILNEAIGDNLVIIGVQLPVLSRLVVARASAITDIIIAENAEFSEIYYDVLDILERNLSLVQLIAFIIIVLVTLMAGLTSYQLISSLNRVQSGYSRVSKGDLQIPVKGKYTSNELGNMDRGFDTMVTEIRRILSAIQRTSERLAGISEELAAGSEEASASVQDVANTVREFSSGASEQNLLLNRIETRLQEHLRVIEDTSNRINQTSSFVLKVAKRTNILGLNASIEAAKAGRFGLGFDVVAEEVRNLSDETKKSAIEIADLIESIESRIRNTVREIQHQVTITKDVAENTAAGSEEASASTSEQVIMLNEISQTSNEVSLLASELAEIVHKFKV